MRETVQLPAVDPDSTEKRVAIQSSFLGRLIQKQQDELARSQRNIEQMLQAWQSEEKQ